MKNFFVISIVVSVCLLCPSVFGVDASKADSEDKSIDLVPDWIGEPDIAGAKYGASVATAGDVNGDGYVDTIIGAYEYDDGHIEGGIVYVYHGSPTGFGTTPDWSYYLEQADAYLGISVSTAGDTNGDGYCEVIIGAPQYGTGGRVLVVPGSSSGLSVNALEYWTADSGSSGAFAGLSVDTAGDVNGDGYSDIIMGAPYLGNGYATVYHGGPSSGGNPTGLSDALSPDWFYTSDQAAWCGFSVSTAGDVNRDGYSDVIIGAPYYDTTGADTDDGKAFLFLGGAVTGDPNYHGLNSTPIWTADGTQAGAHFGWSVAGVGSIRGASRSDVVIGEPDYDGGGNDQGRFFVYHGHFTTGLETTPHDIIPGLAPGDKLGYNVSHAGDVNSDGYADVIVGAPYYDVDTGEKVILNDAGIALLYYGTKDGIDTGNAISFPGDQADSNFGFAVSTAGDVNGDAYSDIIIGAPMYTNGQANEGSAFVYMGGYSGPNENPDWIQQGSIEGEHFGRSIACAGDVDGDGYTDVIVGASRYDSITWYNPGGALLYKGSPTGLKTYSNWLYVETGNDQLFGYSVAGAGDVNGDGYGDVIIGAPNKGYSNRGKVYLFLGEPTNAGLETTATWSMAVTETEMLYGSVVDTAGDVNGDGYADVIISAGKYDSSRGLVEVYLGNENGLASTPQWTQTGESSLSHYGCDVASAGDVNGDGYSDIIVGEFSAESPRPGYYGGAHVYYGSPAGLSTTPAWTGFHPYFQTMSMYGYAVSSAGDVNADGYSDVIVGAPHGAVTGGNPGMVFLYLGSSSGLNQAEDWYHEGGVSNEYFGKEVSPAGDVNGDGYSDFLVTDDGHFVNPLTGKIGSGDSKIVERVVVFYGADSVPGNEPDVIFTGDQEDSSFGSAIAHGGDINGDGFSEILVGAYLHDEGFNDAGKGYMHYGNGSNGKGMCPMQVRVNDTNSIIGPLGMSDETDSAVLRMKGRFAGGRYPMYAQWELKPFGTPLDGTGINNSSWYYTAPGTPTSDVTAVEELHGGLAEDARYHWRMRTQYQPGHFMGLLHSRWFVPWFNGPNELDFLTGNNYTPSPTPTPFPGENCSNPILISVGDCVAGTLSYYNENNHDCGDYHEGGDIVYELDLATEMDLIFLGEATYNADWTIATSCSETAGDILCANYYAPSAWYDPDLSCSGISASGYSPLEFGATLAAGTYYIWVDSSTNNEFGDYYLEIIQGIITPTPTPTEVPPTPTPTFTPPPPTDTPVPPTFTPTPPPPTPTPEGPSQVDTFCITEWEATGFNNARRIVKDADGYFHLVFHSQNIAECGEFHPGNPPGAPQPCTIYYTRSLVPADGKDPGPPPWNSTYWNTPSIIAETYDELDDRYPAIAIEYGSPLSPEDNDRIHVVWQRERTSGGVYDIYYSTCLNQPALPCEWEDGTGSPGFRALYISATSEGEFLPRNSLVPSICINNGNDIHVAWQEENFLNEESFISPFSEILYKGSCWIGWDDARVFNENISQTPETNSQMPSLACALDNPETFDYGSDRVHILWNDDGVANPPNVFYNMSLNDGQTGTWTNLANWSILAETGGFDGYPSLAVDPTDHPFGVWMHGVTPDDPDETSGGGRGIYGPGIDPLDTGGLESFPGPEAGMYSAGDQEIWLFNDHSGSIPVNSTSERPSDSEFPSVTLTTEGIITVTWQGWFEEDYEIWMDDSLTGFTSDRPISSDTGHDDLFPSTCFKKDAMWYDLPGKSSHEDLAWIKIDTLLISGGHNAAAALTPPHEIWFAGSSLWAPPAIPPTNTPTPAPTNTPTPLATDTPTPTPTTACIHHGDVNFSGDLTAGDAQLAFSIVLGAYLPSYEEECAADCNDDGSVTAGDAQSIFGAVLGMDSCADPI